MAIKSIRDRISNIASGEILGEADKAKEEKEKQESEKRAPKKQTPKVEKKPKVKKRRKRKQSPKKEKVSKDNFFKRKEEVEVESPVEEIEVKEEEEEVIDRKPIQEEVEGYEDVLSILGIKENLNLDVDFKSDNLDYIEFTQTTPLGFDFDEVTDFISKTKYTLNKLESALNQRNKELVIVASEVKKVEQKMIERNQERELEKMIGDMTEEERLIAENIDLRIEISELKGKLLEAGSNPMNQSNSQLEALEAENEMLRFSSAEESEPSNTKSPLPLMSQSEPIESNSLPADIDNSMNEIDNSTESAHSLDDNASEMPNIDLADDDSVDSMIRDIGGMYDDE